MNLKSIYPAHREPTQAEINIARAWVARHPHLNVDEAQREYLHALALLVFANARPPRREKGTPA